MTRTIRVSVRFTIKEARAYYACAANVVDCDDALEAVTNGDGTETKAAKSAHYKVRRAINRINGFEPKEEIECQRPPDFA